MSIGVHKLILIQREGQGMRLKFDIKKEGSKDKEVVYNWKVIVRSDENLVVTSTDDYENEVVCFRELGRFVKDIETDGDKMLVELYRRLVDSEDDDIDDILSSLGLGNL